MMSPKLILSILLVISYSDAVTYNVKTSSELNLALSSVNAGDTISLADGTYIGNFYLKNLALLYLLTRIHCIIMNPLIKLFVFR